MAEKIIQVTKLSKSFDISIKADGIKGTLKHFLKEKQKVLRLLKI